MAVRANYLNDGSNSSLLLNTTYKEFMMLILLKDKYGREMQNQTILE